MTADARLVVAEGVKLAVALPEVPEHRRADADSEAWDKLSAGVKASKADPEALGGHSIADARQTLEFLVAYTTRKKALKGRIKECIKLLFAHPGWLQAAQSSAELAASIEGAFSDDVALLQRLQESVTDSGSEGTEAGGKRISLDDLKGDALEVKKSLMEGFQVMESFGWSFPPSGLQTTDRDTATEGFQKVHAAITRLALVLERGVSTADSERYVEAILADFEDVLPKAPGFLQTMARERRVFSSKVAFVVSKLSLYSPSFKAAADGHAGLEEPGEAAPEPSEAPALAATRAKKAEVVVRWQIGLAQDWKDLDPQISAEIEKAWLAGAKSCPYSLAIGGETHKYVADLMDHAALKQRREDTGKERPLRRHEREVEAI